MFIINSLVYNMWKKNVFFSMEPKVMFSNHFTSKDSSCTIINDKEKHKIITFKKLEPANV